MRILRRVLLGMLAAGLLFGQGLTGSSASANTNDPGQVRIVPSLLVYGETRGALMTELWTYWYQRQIGDPSAECLSIGKNDTVLVGAHDSTCTIRLGRPILSFLEQHVRLQATTAVVRRHGGGPESVRAEGSEPGH